MVPLLWKHNVIETPPGLMALGEVTVTTLMGSYDSKA